MKFPDLTDLRRGMITVEGLNRNSLDYGCALMKADEE